MSRRTAILLCPVLLLTAMPAPAATPHEIVHEIRLERGARAGQRFRLRVEATDDRIVTARVFGGESVVYDAALSVQLEADAEVLEVDADGHPCRMLYRLDHCLREVGDRWVPVVPAGALVTAIRLGEATRFEVGDAAADPAARRVLELVLGFDALARDDVHGATMPRRLGESWPVDPERVAAGLAAAWGVRPAAEDLRGSGILVDAPPIDGSRCLRVRHTLTAENVLPGREEFPSDFDLQRSVVDASIQGLFPEDPALPPRGISARTRIDAVLTGSIGPSDAPVELHVGTSRVVLRETIPFAE